MASSQVSSGSQQTVASRLVDAAKLGQVEIVRDLLRKNPNEIDSLVNGQNALQWASVNEHIDVVQVLLEAGANKETKNNHGLSSLQCAVVGNRPQAVKLLLDEGADINSTDNIGLTPLHMAIYQDNKEVTELLLNHPKIDFSIKNKNGSNALHYVIMIQKEINRPEAVKMLLEKGAEINSTGTNGNTALHLAVSQEQKEVIEVLTNHPRIDFNIKNKWGSNVLNWAIMMEQEINRPEAVKSLLEKGVDINSTDNNGRTPLHNAIWREKKEVIELLINHPKNNFSIKDNEGCNALHYAIMVDKEINRPEAVKTLLDKGADVNSTDNKGRTPLHNAIWRENKEVIKLLSNHPKINFSIKDNEGCNTLHYAINVEKEINRTEAVKMLLEKGAVINLTDNDGNTALHVAVSKEQKEVIEVLSNHPRIDFDIKNKWGSNVLHYAIMMEKEINRPEAVKTLLEKGIDINSRDNDGNTVLHNAIWRNNKEVIELLINHANIDFSIKNKQGHNALHHVIIVNEEINRPEAVKAFLEKGVDINSRDNYGNTVLHNAIWRNNKEVIELLINHPNIDFSIKNKQGRNALHHAIMVNKEINRPEAVKILLDKGLEINSTDNNGRTPLHNAIWRDNKEVIELLINHSKIDISIKDNQGYNSLHYAIMVEKEINRLAAVKMLLEKGADCNSKDNNGNTPLNNSIWLGHEDVMELLLSHPKTDISIKNNDGRNALHCVIWTNKEINRLAAVKMLLEKGADCNSKDNDGDTPLNNSIWRGPKDVMELLLSYPKTDISIKNNDGHNALHCAVLTNKDINQLEVLQLLLQKGAEINSVSDMGNTSLHMAIENGNTEVMELLISNPNIDISLKNKQGLNVLHFAVLVPDVIHRLEIVKVMLQNGADVNSDSMIGNTALHMAIDNGVTEVLEVLIDDPKIDFSLKNKQGFNVLHRAVLAINMADRKEVVQLMLQKGADVNSVDDYGYTPLHHAICIKDKEVIEILINQPNIDFSLKNQNSDNALHFAVSEGAERVTALILQNEPDLINSKNEEGRTALHFAAHNGQVQIAKLLIEKGADVNISDNKQQTPLHVAVRKACLPIVELIVANKADLNIRDEHGNTCLHLAVKEHSGHPSADVGPAWSMILDQVGLDDKTGFTITCFLVKKGADVNIVNNEGLTASEMIQDPVKKEAFKNLIETFTFKI